MLVCGQELIAESVCFQAMELNFAIRRIQPNRVHADSNQICTILSQILFWLQGAHGKEVRSTGERQDSHRAGKAASHLSHSR